MKRTTSIQQAGTSHLPQHVLHDVAAVRHAMGLEESGPWSEGGDGPGLVALCGLPGTGKSYFASRLTELMPLVVLGSDRLRKVLVPEPRYTPEEHSRVFNTCHQLIEDLLKQDRRVLFDATNLTEAFRRPLYRICDRMPAPLILVRFTAPRKIIRRRLAEREKGLNPGDYSDADWLVYCRLSPHEEPVGRRHFNVDSSQDVSPVLESVARLLASTHG